MSHSPSKVHLSINTRPSFLLKQSSPHHASFAVASSAVQNQAIFETGVLPKQVLLAKNLNPIERIATLEKKIMKILLNVFFHFSLRL